MSAPRDVIVAALAVALPCPVCGREATCRCIKPAGYSATEERATLIEAALIEHGHLAPPERPATEQDIDDAARWLADKSRHPRYVDVEEGWRKLLESSADVELACACAARSASQSDVETIARVRGLLLAALAARRASGAVSS